MAGEWKTLSVALVANTVGYSSGLAKASADTKAFGKEVESAQTKAGDQKSWLSASTAIAGIGVAAIAAGAVLFRIGEDFGNAFRTIRQETGATGKSLDGLQTSLKNVYAQRPESLQQVTDVIVQLNRQLGLTGPALEQLAVAELRLASITKTDVSSVLQTTTALFNNYGVAASQQVSKLDELYRVHEHTGVAITDLAQQMTTIGPVTRSLGLTFEQSAALVGELSKSGVDASSTMMAFGRVLKEASAAGVDGSVYLGRVFDQIRAAPNATAAAGIAVQEFGARAARFSDLIRSGKLDFQSFTAALTGGTDTIGKSAIATASWSAKVKIALHDVEVQLQPLGSKVFEGVVKGAAEVLPAIQKLITAGGRDLVAFFKELAPAGKDLVAAFRDLGPILHTAAVAAEPFAKALVLIAAGTAVVVIRGLAAGLRDLTSFLSHNELLVKALTASLIALGAVKAFNFLSDVGSAGLMVLNNVLLSSGAAMATLSERATLFAGAIAQARIGDFEGALTSAGAAATGLGAALATFVVPVAAVLGIMNIESSAKKADDYAKSLAASFDHVSVLDTSAFQANMTSLADKIASVHQQLVDMGGPDTSGGAVVSAKELGNELNSIGSYLTGNAAKGDKLSKAYQALLTEQDKLAQKSVAFNNDLLGMSMALGLPQDKIQGLLEQFKIDPTQTGFAKGLAQLKTNLANVSKETGVSTAQMASFMDAMSPQEATDFAKAIAQVGTSMQSTMDKFGDLSSMDISKGVSGAGIEKFYADKVKAATDFVNNIRAAVQKGFDPSVIQQLMTAGPDAAGPILQAMVSDTSGTLVKQVNDGVTALSNLSEQSIMLARATYLATTTPVGPTGDRIVAEYKNAVAAIIDAANGIPPDLIAKKLNLNPDQYNKLAQDYGLGLITDVQSGVDGAPPVNVPVQVDKTLAIQAYEKMIHDPEFGPDNPLTVAMKADPARANAAVALWIDWASTQQGQAILSADPKKGREVLGDLIFGFNHATGVATLDADATKAVEKYTLFVTRAGQVVVLPIDANLQAAEDRLNGFITDADRRSVTIDVYTRTGQINAAGQSVPSRWGNVTAYSAGGVTPAHITPYEIEKYGEPGTGGEAFVPKYGNYTRSRAIIDTAAGWYGLKTVPAWSGPSTVPASSGWSGGAGGHSSSVVVAPGAFQFGNIYGVDDFEKKMATATDQLVQQISREVARR